MHLRASQITTVIYSFPTWDFAMIQRKYTIHRTQHAHMPTFITPACCMRIMLLSEERSREHHKHLSVCDPQPGWPWLPHPQESHPSKLGLPSPPCISPAQRSVRTFLSPDSPSVHISSHQYATSQDSRFSGACNMTDIDWPSDLAAT